MDLPVMWLDLQRLLMSARFQELSLEGGGVYLKLLAAHWVCGPKGLPGSLEKIAQLLATTPEKLRPHWEGPDHLRGFFALKDGRWVNDTAVLLWEKAKGHKDRLSKDMLRKRSSRGHGQNNGQGLDAATDRDDESTQDDDHHLDSSLKTSLEDKSSTSRSRSYGRSAHAREASVENSPKTRPTKVDAGNSPLEPPGQNSAARLEAHHALTPEQRDNVKWLRAHFSPARALEIALEISFTEEDRRAWEAWRKRHGDIDFKQKVQTFQNPKDAPKPEKGADSGYGYDLEEKTREVVANMQRLNEEREQAKKRGPR